MNEPLPFVAVVFGVVFVLLAGVYALVPADALPSFVPGFDPALHTMHVKHGLASLFVGVGLRLYAWFATRSEKRRS